MSAIIPVAEFNVAPLTEIAVPENFAQALDILASAGVEVSDASVDMADDFPEIAKEKLVNRPFLMLGWTVSDPETSENGQYVVVRGITSEGQRFRFADGSTGIFRQLARLTYERVQNGSATPNAGLLCPNGLSRSDYTTMIDGKPTKATTFYVNNSAN